jgi:Flp pilus assembly protein TadG
MSAGKAVRHRRSFRRDQRGATAVEFGLIGGMLILTLMGIVDFANAYWQWNRAAKAVQLGVRLASVSDPVSSDLKTYDGTSTTVFPGDDMPAFQRVCTGATATCTNGTYDATAMNTLVYGRGNTACPATPGVMPGMCNLFPSIRPQNVIVEYLQTGLGYAGRPGGPVPTITLRLTGLSYRFIVLNALLRYTPITMSGLSATATAEDISGR